MRVRAANNSACSRGIGSRREDRARARTGFTLLEVVIATAFLAMVVVASLQLRSSGIRALQRVQSVGQKAAEREELFGLVTQGLIEAEVERLKDGVVIWRGVHHKERFTVTREFTVVRNPLPRLDWQDEEQRGEKNVESVLMPRYTVEFKGERDVFYWHK